jgi:hypothetical protein
MLLSIVGLACAADGAISDSELSLGGVALGETESNVLAMLGAPLEQSETGEGTALEYPGLTVFVGWLEQQAPGKERRVLQLSGTGSNACTPSGICPGMRVERVMAAYGQPVVAGRETGDFLEYYSHQSSCWLQVGTSEGSIRSVSAVCQP